MKQQEGLCEADCVRHVTAVGADLVAAVVKTLEQLRVDGTPRFITDAPANLHRKQQQAVSV
jgi:hypothetical protein